MTARAESLVLQVPPDPLPIAATLWQAGRPGVTVLASRPVGALRKEDARYSFVACDPIEASDGLVPGVPAEPPPHGGAPLRELDPVPCWLGVVPYEGLRGEERASWTRSPDERRACALARPAWRRYAAVVRIDHATGEVRVVGDDAGSVARLAKLARVSGGSSSRPVPARARCTLQVRDPEEEADAHVARVRSALELIAAGDLYEVNVARRLRVSLQGDALELFTRLVEVAPTPWAFFQDLGQSLVIATSPELALSVNGDRLRTCPIKGTRPRGRDAEEDARWADELSHDPKELAELTMAVDVHRNDLGRVAVPGSVEVTSAPRLLRGTTVWSRVAEVVARRAPGVSLEDIARSVLPCGSVTGAPKVRAMEVIARLEPWRRGLYTGAMGYVGRGERLELAMAIRTLQLTRTDGGWAGDYFTGGGIVADSVPERELEETRWKAAQLARLASDCATSGA